MIPTSFDLATIALVEVNGKQEIRIIPKESVDLVRCLQTLFSLSNQNTTALPTNLGDYFESLLITLKLPISLYRQKTYSAIRSLSTKKTLVYWNCNSRAGYLNVNAKTSITETFQPGHGFFFGADARFSNTQRARLYSVSEVDEFFVHLSTALTSALALP